MSGRVVIVGSGGYIGANLCQALLAKGVEVIEYSSNKEGGISSTEGIFLNELNFPKNTDAVYYLAQSPYYREMPAKSSHLLSVNCIAATQAAEAARRADIPNFIYTSTGNVYQPSFKALNETSPVRRDNWYSLSKVMAEESLALYKPYMNLSIARIFGVYGPKQTNKLVPMIAERIRSGLEIQIDKNPHDANDLDGLAVSLIYIDDLVKMLLSFLDTNINGIMNLAGNSAISIRKLTIELAKCMGLEYRIKINDKTRECNLIADIDLQNKTFNQHSIIDFPEGIHRFCSTLMDQ